jgi:putative peptidoglycan lipid II flippase
MLHSSSRRAEPSIARTLLLLVPVQVTFRAGEALLPLLLAAWFGRDQETDVYYFAWAVFALAGSLLFSVHQDSALVPVLAELRARDPKKVAEVSGSLLAHTLAGGAALSAAIALAAAALFCVRYSGPALSVALWMVPPFATWLLAVAVRTFFGGLLNAHHRFFFPAVGGPLAIATTLAVIATARGRMGIVAVPVGSVAGELAAAGLLAAVAMGPAGLRLRLSFARPEPVRTFARLAASEVGGGAVTRINPVVDQLMAGLAGVVGGGTLLRLSGDVASVPTSLLQATLLPVLLSHLADAYATRGSQPVRATARRAVAVVGIVMAAAAALLWLVRGPLLRLVFLHGQMDAEGVETLARLLPYHLVGLAPFGVLLVLARAHIAIRNSRIMLGMGVLNAALNAGFNLLLLPVLGLAGIALSTSCVYAVVAVVFWIRLQSPRREPSWLAPRRRPRRAERSLGRPPPPEAQPHRAPPTR